MITVTLTDLANERSSDLIKLAKFILEYAGYDAAVAAVPAVSMQPDPVPDVTNFPEIGVPEFVPPAPVPPAVTNIFNLPLPPVQQVPGIEVDSAGMPWDGRIHASSRARVADGTWRQRRNLAPDVLTKVMGELKQTMGIPTPPPAVIPVDVASGPDMTGTVELNPGEAEAMAAFQDAIAVPTPPPFVPSVVVPAAPAAITPPPPSTQAGVATTVSHSDVTPVTFPQLMQKITQAFTAKTLDQASILAAVQSVGLPALPMLASRPDLVPAVATALGIAL